MKINLFAVIALLILTSGCTTARLNKGPDIFALTRHSGSIPVGVTKALDERGTTKAGTIGANTILVKSDIRDLATNYVIHALNTRMTANVIRMKDLGSEEVRGAAAQHQVARIVIPSVKRLKIYSFDSIMQPVQVDIDLNFKVYDEAGNRLYDGLQSGHYEDRLGFSLKTDKMMGEYIEGALKEAVNNLTKDELFRIAITKS